MNRPYIDFQLIKPWCFAKPKEVQKLFKLNFEKTAIFVLILIIVISTANICSQFFRTVFDRREHNEVQTDIITNMSFPAGLLKADQLYSQNLYKEAQTEYFMLTGMQNLSPQQKATVHFKLGICNYKLNEYDLAINSFLKSAEFNTDDPVAYNNAAVCAFYQNELERAEELQKKAIVILPVIEYHYNLARIYEAAGRYEDSVKYYSAVANAEENITREDRIDPVRIKNKVMNLMINISDPEKISKELMIALKLKESREVFIIEDVNMDIKDKSFKWSVVKKDGHSRLNSSYDRKNSDPYNLIESIEWTVKKGTKAVYNSKEDSFEYSLLEGNDYTVYLDINYGANKQASSYAEVMKSSGTKSNPVVSKPTSVKPAEPKSKYYVFAVYEQVFEKNFDISKQGYIDRFNAVWGKDDVETKVMDKDFRDAGAALYVNNTSSRRAGIWADLSSVVNDKHLEGRTIRIKFQARKITDEAGLYINIRTKTGKSYNTILKKPQLEFKWQEFTYDLDMPLGADGLTISFKTEAGEEIKMDAFYILIIK